MNEHQEEGTKVLIMGVGRSGTTAIYALLQEVLENVFPNDVDYVYEPFLWARGVFNRPYKTLTDEFSYSASISIEGMYHHKRIPMFAGESCIIDPQSQAWLKDTLTAGGGKRQYLGKMIRANGRIGLIRKLSPNIKIIFMIRNPIDVLNSASQLFSFYGSEFYVSDFSRFRDEVETQYGRDALLPDAKFERIVAEYQYWHFSNLAFQEYAKENPSNILCVSYEALIEDRKRIVQCICEFLGLEFLLGYVSNSDKPVGTSQQGASALTKDEFEFLQSKLEGYSRMLDALGCAPVSEFRNFIRTPKWGQVKNVSSHLFGINSMYCANELSHAINELAVCKAELARLQLELAKIKASKRYKLGNHLLSLLDKLRKVRKTET